MSSTDDTPNYRFYRRPRFSANHLAEYMCTQDAGQRDGVIRKAKFPRKTSVTAYQQVVPAFRAFITKGDGDHASLDDLAARLSAKALREEGYNQAEALRCVAAIDAFKEAYAVVKWGKASFLAGPQDASMKLADVTVNVRLDPPIVEWGGEGESLGGGCVMFLANSPDARKNIEDRRIYVAAIAHWALEGGNLPTAPRMCMSFDVFGKSLTKAPASFTRLRKRMEDSCREAALKWDSIEPPSGYDGPEWR